jgi:hypothetical protein
MIDIRDIKVVNKNCIIFNNYDFRIGNKFSLKFILKIPIIKHLSKAH